MCLAVPFVAANAVSMGCRLYDKTVQGLGRQVALDVEHTHAHMCTTQQK
jgi:hypothetical protein